MIIVSKIINLVGELGVIKISLHQHVLFGLDLICRVMDVLKVACSGLGLKG